MNDDSGFLKKNWFSMLLLVLLAGVSVMWIKDRNEAKMQDVQTVEQKDSADVVPEASCDVETEVAEDVQEDAADPLTDAPVVRLSPSLIKGPACMVENTFESYYPRNVIDGNRSTAWGLEAYQGNGGTFVFRMPCSRLDHIVVWNGNWGEMGAWEDNARVRRLTLSKKNAAGEVVEIGTFTLTNRHQSQTLQFAFDAAEVRDIETLTVTASGKYEGILFQDLYLAELIFYGNK